MNQSLLDQLKAIGADSDQFASSEAIAVTDRLQIVDRDDLSIVRFSAADSSLLASSNRLPAAATASMGHKRAAPTMSEFLQSQTCNDHAQVTASKAQLTGYCSPKGRLLALPTVVQDPSSDTVYWLLPKAICDSVVKRLKMFVLNADVSIDIQQDWVVMGAAASPSQLETSADSDLTPWLGSAETAAMTSWGTNNHVVCKARSAEGVSRTLMFGSAADVGASILACADAASSPLQWASAASWVLGDIQAGVPSIVTEIQDAFVPQMVNLEQVDGLSFTKGCYPGQEIVARMQYLGKIKRTMMRFTGQVSGELKTPPLPGQTLSCGEDLNAGQVVASSLIGDSIEMLAVVKTSADASAFALADAALSAQELPYT